MIYAHRVAGVLGLLTALAGCVSEPGEFGRQELTTFYEQEVAATNARLVEEIGQLDSCIRGLDAFDSPSLAAQRPKACGAAAQNLGPDAYFIRALQPVLASYQQAVTRAARGGRGDRRYAKVAKLVEDYESLKELYLIRFAQAQIYARRIEDLEYLMARQEEGEAAPASGAAREGAEDPDPEPRFEDWDDRED